MRYSHSVRTLRDTLWHVDGHEDVFSRRSSAIPSAFASFKGYNCPEKTKHRKRQHGNLSRDQLNTMATELAVLLQSNAWEREHWCNFKEDVAGLVRALAGYAEYLTQKNKIVKVHHASATPVRELLNHLRVKFLPSRSTSVLIPTSLASVEEALYSKSSFDQSPISCHPILYGSIVWSKL